METIVHMRLLITSEQLKIVETTAEAIKTTGPHKQNRSAILSHPLQQFVRPRAELITSHSTFK